MPKEEKMKITRRQLKKLIREVLTEQDTGDTGDTGYDDDCLEGLVLISKIVGAADKSGRYLTVAIPRLVKSGKLDNRKTTYEDMGWYLAQDIYHKHLGEGSTVGDLKKMFAWVSSNLLNDDVRDVMAEACNQLTDQKIARLANGIAWYYNHTGAGDDSTIHGNTVEEILSNGYGKDDEFLVGGRPLYGMLKTLLG